MGKVNQGTGSIVGEFSGLLYGGNKASFVHWRICLAKPDQVDTAD